MKKNKEEKILKFNKRISVMKVMAKKAGFTDEQVDLVYTQEQLEKADAALDNTAAFINGCIKTFAGEKLSNYNRAQAKRIIMNMLTVMLGAYAADDFDYHKYFKKTITKYFDEEKYI